MTSTATTGPLHATVVVRLEDLQAAIDPRLFGTFVEHLGRCVYSGIYEPGHPTADAHGFRADVGDLTRELGVSVVRYPGGNFVSGYRWEDGLGSRDSRPRRVDLAWRSIESNHVGTDDFLNWAARQGLEPMMAVNLGTRGLQAAANLVEYTNVRGGTAWSDLRRANGNEQPHNVKLWCLGNEMDGPWQTGHKTAAEYGALASEAAKAMRAVDPSIQLVACGSSAHDMPTFGSWESTVLEHTYPHIDYISLHAYYEQHGDDRTSFLASGTALERYIDEVVATADSVKARLNQSKTIHLSLDEWNVWYMSRFAMSVGELEEAPELLEDIYSVLDAVVVGDLLVSILKRADRVKIGCQAQLVNVIAPIRTQPGGPAWRQTIFYPFAQTAANRGTHVLGTSVGGPMLDTARHGEVAALNMVVTATQVTDTEASIAAFFVNRATAPLLVTVEHPGLTDLHDVELSQVVADAAGPRSGALAAGAANPRRQAAPTTESSRTTVLLPAESWSMLRAVGVGCLG